jgi:hypothetical protein
LDVFAWHSGRHSTAPNCYHVVVHLLQLLLGHLQGVRRRVELVCLEALIAEGDLERLIIGLHKHSSVRGPRGAWKRSRDRATAQWRSIGAVVRKKKKKTATGDRRTRGMELLSTCDDAALVVTVLRAAAKETDARGAAWMGNALGTRRARENILTLADGGMVDEGIEGAAKSDRL